MTVKQIESQELRKEGVKLEDEVNADMSAVVVDEYLNAKSGTVYQLDRTNHRFRQAEDGGAYGDWTDCS